MRKKRLRVLWVAHSPALREQVRAWLVRAFAERVEIVTIAAFTDAVEHLEKRREIYPLIAVESPGSSQVLIQALVDLAGTAAVIVFGGEDSRSFGATDAASPLFRLPSSGFDDELGKLIKKLEITGRIPSVREPGDEGFLAIRGSVLLRSGALPADVYLRVTEGRYVLTFKKGESVTETDLARYETKSSRGTYFIRAEDEPALLAGGLSLLRSLSEQKSPDPAEVERAFTRNYGVVRDVVAQVGFTPEAQEVALTSVAATLKLLESSPQLSRILHDLGAASSEFIAGRSFQLGKVACALSHRIGWRSNSTYFKLSLAAFLHDLPLTEDRLVGVRDLEEAMSSGAYTEEDLRTVRMHPVKAAEYAREFSQIPQDVEQILMQHHERPNGTGFPRGLVARYFSPLAALFVIAQDLVDHATKNPNLTIEDFLKEFDLDYRVGIFRKICRSLRENTPLT